MHSSFTPVETTRQSCTFTIFSPARLSASWPLAFDRGRTHIRGNGGKAFGSLESEVVQIAWVAFDGFSLYGTASLRTSKRAAGERISRAYEQIFEMIVHGRLPPGARIAEGPLAEMLGVSRTPVRESLQRLRQEGLLIEVGGGSGLRGRLAVAPLQRERMEELYALTAAIEALAVRGLNKVEATQREELARRLEKIESAFHAEARRRAPEYDRLFELHHAFHRALVEAAAGPETRAVLRTIKPQMDRYEWFYAPMAGPDFTPTRREHAAIVEAVRHGTAHELERAVRANWLNAAQRLGPLIERFDGRLPAGAPVFSVFNKFGREASLKSRFSTH